MSVILVASNHVMIACALLPVGHKYQLKILRLINRISIIRQNAFRIHLVSSNTTTKQNMFEYSTEGNDPKLNTAKENHTRYLALNLLGVTPYDFLKHLIKKL